MTDFMELHPWVVSALASWAIKLFTERIGRRSSSDPPQILERQVNLKRRMASKLAKNASR
jgi:hypothetical protein